MTLSRGRPSPASRQVGGVGSVPGCVLLHLHRRSHTSTSQCSDSAGQNCAARRPVSLHFGTPVSLHSDCPVGSNSLWMRTCRAVYRDHAVSEHRRSCAHCCHQRRASTASGGGGPPTSVINTVAASRRRCATRHSTGWRRTARGHRYGRRATRADQERGDGQPTGRCWITPVAAR